jgi:hypothetical protein
LPAVIHAAGNHVATSGLSGAGPLCPHELRQHVHASRRPVALETLDFMEFEGSAKIQ